MPPTELPPTRDLIALTRALHPRLVGMLALYLGDRQLAEDLAQEALIRLHQHWSSVQRHPSPEAWTSRVALNLARSWWRRRGAERRANQRLTVRVSPAPVDPDEVIAIRDAVASLPSRLRGVVVLRFYLGLSVKETAEAVRRPEGTVKSLTSTAVAELRRVLTDDAGPVDGPHLSKPPLPMESFHG